jgi:elongation factor P
VELLLYQGEILALMLPDKITIKVLRTEPGVRGNTSTTAMKDAYLENEMTIKVPLFIAEGEEIILSTRDGKYISRA